MASFQAKIARKMPGKREYKIIVLFRSYPTRNRKLKKKAKKLKNTIMASFQAKIWKRQRKIENKNSRSVSFLQIGMIIFIISLSWPSPTYFGLK